MRRHWFIVTIAQRHIWRCRGVRAGTRGAEFSGIASFYDKNYSGKTASGDRYDGTKLTAAHRTLPFGTQLLVTDKRTHRSVTVTVNDRGPFYQRPRDRLVLCRRQGLAHAGARIDPGNGLGRVARRAASFQPPKSNQSCWQKPPWCSVRRYHHHALPPFSAAKEFPCPPSARRDALPSLKNRR